MKEYVHRIIEKFSQKVFSAVHELRAESNNFKTTTGINQALLGTEIEKIQFSIQDFKLKVVQTNTLVNSLINWEEPFESKLNNHQKTIVQHLQVSGNNIVIVTKSTLHFL